MLRYQARTTILATLFALWLSPATNMTTLFAEPPATQATVSFNRDVLPILADKCYACHGPDAQQREADLRLDVADAVFEDRGGRPIVVPGEPDRSELWRRVAAADESERMPPADSGLQLSPAEREVLRDWIVAGASWSRHWAFEPPRRPALPAVRDRGWLRTPIDAFILAHLETQGVAPSPPADRTTLIRRVTLDLTGLPPTPAEVDAFLADESPRAFERVVDRLLASPRYGERVAVDWLDAARYADTSGYQTDGNRQMWRWRDWVIDAFNRNLPFDQFTIEQLAGDLLPDPTLDQQIATGFHRNHRANSEGGIIDEEFLVEYAVDRVETTGTVWLGLTAGCARCHDHKYDPLTQRDFYRLMAFFNNVPERGRVFKHHNSEPVVKAPTPSMRMRRNALIEQLHAARERWSAMQPVVAASQQAWESSVVAAPLDENLLEEPLLDDGLAVRLPLDGNLDMFVAEPLESEDATKPDGEPSAATDSGARQAVSVDGEPSFVSDEPLAAARQLPRFDGRAYVDAGPVMKIDGTQPITVAAWVRPDRVQDGAILSVLDPAATRAQGFSLQLHDNRLAFHIGPRWIDDALRLETRETIPAGQWHHVAVVYDGSEQASGVRLFIDGVPQPVDVRLDKLTGGFTSDQPLRIGFGAEGMRFAGDLADVRLYRRALAADEVAVIACPDAIARIVATPPVERGPIQGEKLAWYFLHKTAPSEIRDAHRALDEARRRYEAFEADIPTSMVMRDSAEPVPTFVLERGQYDQPDERVVAGVPDWLSPLPDGAAANRLGLARWLVSPEHPLTARVAVNRTWQRLFGRGLVETSEDFGTQGTRPLHAELLDWLATEFVRLGWDQKQLDRLIVCSAVYRQSSHVRDDLAQRDPDNHWLARAPRVRLPAEAVRDQALAAAGLLGNRIGGPSVKPYQPAGLWKELGSEPYARDAGPLLYRRSLYTFWKRTAPPAGMATFDGPTREFCQVRRSRTNTPLQALALLNDVTYVEAARELARRMLTEGGETAEQRLEYGFRRLLARKPTEAERQRLAGSLNRALKAFAEDPAAARELLDFGDLPTSPAGETANLDPATWAAYTVVANLLFNLDETITRE